MPLMPSTSKRVSLKTKECPICGFEANLKGFASHERACRKQQQNKQASEIFVQCQNIEKGSIDVLIINKSLTDIGYNQQMG